MPTAATPPPLPHDPITVLILLAYCPLWLIVSPRIFYSPDAVACCVAIAAAPP